MQLGLYCESHESIGMIGAIYSVGTAIACVILSVLADKYGRVQIFRFGCGLIIPLLVMIIYTHSITSIYIFCFVLGVV